MQIMADSTFGGFQIGRTAGCCRLGWRVSTGHNRRSRIFQRRRRHQQQGQERRGGGWVGAAGDMKWLFAATAARRDRPGLPPGWAPGGTIGY